MRLDKILENIKAADTAAPEKTASVSTGGVPRDQLLAALNDATSTKTASVAAASPAGDLMKIAADVAATEKEVAVKEAQLLGRAFADAVVARVGEWQSAAASMPATKVASLATGGFDKFASENAELIKQAAELGYTQTQDHLEKVAAAEYERGYNDTMVEVQKLAAEEFAKAAVRTSQILDQIAAQG